MNIDIQSIQNTESKLKNNEFMIQLKLTLTEIDELQRELATVCDTQKLTKLTDILRSMLNFETASFSKF